MGTCCSVNPEANEEIETYMLAHKETNKSTRKLLLLGCGSSGKSTLFKQLKCIFHPWGLESTEFAESTHAIRQNCVHSILKLLKKSQELYESDPKKYAKCLVNLEDDKKLVRSIERILAYRHDTFEHMEHANWNEIEQLGKTIEYLWHDVDGIRVTFNQRGDKFSFVDNMEYYFTKSKLIFAEEFYPSYEDVLKCRIRTTGMTEITYEIKDTFLNIYDVGGQRNERKKWIHCFEHVTAVLYVAALSHFDAVCFEDETQNSMHESITLFCEICNSKWFKRTPFILFLNKSDLFEEKLRDFVNITRCFSRELSGWDGPEYNGPVYEENETTDEQYFDYCYKAQSDFIAQVYYDQRNSVDKKIFTHVTNATDRNCIEKVFWDCQNIVIMGHLSHSGFA
eukprot:23106_1